MCPVMQNIFSLLDGALVGFAVGYIYFYRKTASRCTLVAMGLLGGLAGLHAVLMYVIW